jgi:hypothetical protein
MGMTVGAIVLVLFVIYAFCQMKVGYDAVRKSDDTHGLTEFEKMQADYEKFGRG